MKILILEDKKEKSDKIQYVIKDFLSDSEVDSVDIFLDFAIAVSEKKYDLIIVDLLVPMYKGDEEMDVGSRIVDAVRREKRKNFNTPILALTAYDGKAIENYKELNSYDIVIITFSEDDIWKDRLRDKITACKPPKSYDSIIICALEKEANAFQYTQYQLSETFNSNGLSCRELTLDKDVILLVTAPRMGLVTAAIVTTQVIERFKPKLVCMSGICAGINGSAKIYDTIIFDNCYQHDFGKWTSEGFKTEIIPVQLDHKLRVHISAVISNKTFKSTIMKNLVLSKQEFPEGMDDFDFDIKVASCSSGSAVVDDEEVVTGMAAVQRKLTAFEMESFALYEAARLASQGTKYFSVKSVVDSGSNKGDDFHRVACILAARATCEILKSGVLDS